MRKSKNDYFDYVCPRCFSQLQDCECPRYPSSLLQIDKGIQPAIRKLNRKGYITTGCCEGHYKPDGHATTYICFLENYPALHAIPLPNGFTFDAGKVGIIHVYPEGESERRFEASHVVCMIDLFHWVEALPDNQDVNP